jgi:peroxiredoxin Q/BCP
MAKKIDIGDKAPLFDLSDQHGSIHSLAQAMKGGLVVLQFYPFDQTPNCTEKLCSINQLLESYSAAGISVFGINNASQESHARFANQAALTMPLLSDRDFYISRAYGALWEIGPIKVIRSTTVVVDSNGVIIFYKHGDLPTQRTFISYLAHKGHLA